MPPAASARSMSGKWRAPCLSAIALPWVAATSITAASSAPSVSATVRACSWPMNPTPTTPTLSLLILYSLLGGSPGGLAHRVDQVHLGDVPLQEEGDDQRRHDGEAQCGREVIGLRRLEQEARQRDRQSHRAGAGDQHRGIDELVPGEQEGD